MDSELKRELILDHYENPQYRGLVDGEGYIKINSNSESCIDNIDIQYKIENGKIVDAHFDGEACAISTSATSMMLSKIVGSTVEEAEYLMKNYENMIDEKEYDSEVLGELNAYDTICFQPNRKKCALLPFESLKKAINEK